ncbi:MAG: CoA-binding protein [Desulfobacterales bacterium]|jgi:predicted CoA-binding protein
MAAGRLITDRETIQEILLSSRTVAVVGLSPNPERDSHRVGRYMLENGYDVIPVRPARKEILGRPAYRTLADVPVPVDIVDVFRRSDQIPAVAEEALALRPRVFWMQLGIENHDAALQLTAAGIDVVMNRCIKVEHAAMGR